MALIEVETLTDNFKPDLSAEAVTVHRISDANVELTSARGFVAHRPATEGSVVERHVRHGAPF